MKSILTMAWTAEDPSAFDLAAKLARAFGARLVGLEPPREVRALEPLHDDEGLARAGRAVGDVADDPRVPQLCERPGFA